VAQASRLCFHSKSLEPSLSCLICGSERLRKFLDGPATKLDRTNLGSSRQAVQTSPIWQCRLCGFGFQELRLTPVELSELYHGLDPSVYEAESAGRRTTARFHLRIVQRFVADGRLLDIGCASGQFLRAATEAGWEEIVGVEPADELAHKAESILAGKGSVIGSTLQEARLNPASFEAVTLWDVLEHVEAPLEFLALAASLVRPGGFLFVNVPDLQSIPARVFGGRWPLLLPEHYNYFSPTSLKICGEKVGLKLKRFGQRPVFFSLDYILYRLGQHGVPAVRTAQVAARALGLSKVIVPVLLGEIYGVWQKPAPLTNP
jgi:SAM-dependent methyltransferase